MEPKSHSPLERRKGEVNLPIRSGPVRFAVGSPEGVTSNSWRCWVEKSGVYIACRDNFQDAKVSLHTRGHWRMGFSDQAIKKNIPGFIPANRNRAWDLWSEPPPQLPKTIVAFKLYFPNSELAVRPEHRTSKKIWKKTMYVDIRKRLPPGWMTIVTLFVTTGDIRLRHERNPSICLASLDMGDGRYAQLVAHGDPEGDILDLIDTGITKGRIQAEQAGVKIPPEGYAYMLGKTAEGIRFLVGGRTDRSAGTGGGPKKSPSFQLSQEENIQKQMTDKTQPETLTITYEKSNDFSVRYADGVMVTAMPSGNIYLGFFLDRPHEFESVVHEFTPDGKLGKEVDRAEKKGMCRALQNGLVVTPGAARLIAQALLDTLDKIDALSVTLPPT